MSFLSTLTQTIFASTSAADDLPDWLQSIVDFLVQFIAEIPLLILDIIGFIIKLIVAVG